jgi:hypothetical protein
MSAGMIVLLLVGLASLFLALGVDEGFGSICTFHSSFFAEVTGIDWEGIERKAHESTSMATTADLTSKRASRTFFPSDLIDWGNLRIKMYYNPDTVPPIDADAETFTLTGPIPAGKTTGPTMTGSAFLTAVSMAVPFDDKMSQDATIKWAGKVTFTPSS